MRSAYEVTNASKNWEVIVGESHPYITELLALSGVNPEPIPIFAQSRNHEASLLRICWGIFPQTFIFLLYFAIMTQEYQDIFNVLEKYNAYAYFGIYRQYLTNIDENSCKIEFSQFRG
jgi:hypothetical protein